MSGKKGAKHYSKEQQERIEEMCGRGLSYREIGERMGRSRKQIAELFRRKRSRERAIAAGNPIRPKGRPRKDSIDTAEQEIARLRMENELLRTFLQAVGRM